MFEHNITIVPGDQEITLVSGEKKIACSSRALILHEPPLLPVIYIPRDDVDMSCLHQNKHKTMCPYKGEATYFDLITTEETIENAAWSYEAPNDNVAEIKDFIAFYESAVDILQ